MKKRILIFILLILVGLTAFYGYHYVKLEISANPTDTATSSELQRRKEVSKRSFDGRVEVTDSFTVESTVPGKVFQVYVNKGRKVNKGDSIVLIDNRKDVEEAKALWDEKVLELSEARVRASAAVSELNRITPQFNAGEMNAQTYKETVDMVTLANEELEAVIIASEEAKTRYENAYSGALVKAPADGRIGEISVRNGQDIASGDSLFELNETTVKYISFKGDESVISDIYPGKPLTFIIRDVMFYGTVISIHPEENKPGVYVVKARPKTDVDLPDGMGVKVRIGEIDEEDIEEFEEMSDTGEVSETSDAAETPNTTESVAAQ
ncbi:hypothetical protein BXO88_09650 [Oribacterium sp. C9]|uniref:efflux RND transporter periplasmic adaptor subunit n=1 Tax=Oribacterium sp. C9 TaxID=1943579 RepID=UPI00098FC4AF|nr:biotin/lipoyl-binding protein [Oribacterium sp. C9]OON85890.1 hypothetical protein BXO88_09650 [Oribacterium sp. C9]